MTSPGDTEAGDRGRLLWHLAHAGAELRQAEQEARDPGFRRWDPERLDLDSPPRAVLVATDEPTSLVADLLRVLAAPVAPVTVLRWSQLPGFAGANDAVVVTALDGHDPRLLSLVDQAARRGCSLLVVAPAGSPLAAATGRGVLVDLARDTPPRAAGWRALGPVLVAAGVWRLTTVGPRLPGELATALDEVAHACRPASDAVANPARALAEEFAEAQPVLVGAGQLAAVAADRFAVALRVIGGVPAVALHLPEDVAQVTAVLAVPGGGAGNDFFRDRVDEPTTLPRVVVIGSDGPDDRGPVGPVGPDGGDRETDHEALAAVRVVEQAAHAVGARVTSLDVPRGDPLVRFAGAVQLGLFTAAYLALARGADPSTPRPGELS